MKTLHMASLIAGALALTACGGGDDTPPVSTTSQLVSQEIAQNTREDSVPIMINDLPISAADTDETSSPSPI